MSNLENQAVNSASFVQNSPQNEQVSDDDALIAKLQEMQDMGTLQSLSPLSVARLAKDFGVSERQVRYSVKLISQMDSSDKSQAPDKEVLNGNCGYYWGDSKVKASDDSMDNMVNQANWNRMMFNIR